MKAAAVAVALFSAAGVLAQSGPLTINTPTAPVVCEPLQLTWSGGTPPYFLVKVRLVPGGQANAAALIDFGQQTGNSLTWTVNLTVGTSVNLDLRDNTGALAQSAPFTIQNGPSTSCLTSGGSAGGSSTSAGSTPAGASTTGTTSAGTTTGANTNTAPGPTSTPGTSSATTKASNTPSGSAPSTSPTNAAVSLKTAGGLATALGAALVALLMA
ncbi:hypothetical protein CVT26_011549 [Gymnopilus dilepis]|uniref:Uncharacterized protein n=1 Tax=Gymnopilus dilepis TaxID=231916 RepID=A0A409W918_9AGAR|nr:hypothetical protein CVT26_011549 [Gymnopilus dilepis]